MPPPLNSGEFNSRPRLEEEQQLLDEIERSKNDTSLRIFSIARAAKYTTKPRGFLDELRHETTLDPLMTSYHIDGDPENVWTRSWIDGRKDYGRDGYRSVDKHYIYVSTDRVSIEEGVLKEIEGSLTHQFSCNVTEDAIDHKKEPEVTGSIIRTPGYNDFNLQQRIEFMISLNDTLDMIEQGVRGIASSSVQVAV